MTSPRQVASACASGAADQHPLRPHQMTTGAANGGRKHRSIRREPDQLADRDHGPTVGVFPACDIKNSGELAEKERLWRGAHADYGVCSIRRNSVFASLTFERGLA
jgi:hypothetical protein